MQSKVSIVKKKRNRCNCSDAKNNQCSPARHTLVSLSLWHFPKKILKGIICLYGKFVQGNERERLDVSPEAHSNTSDRIESKTTNRKRSIIKHAVFQPKRTHDEYTNLEYPSGKDELART
jgi:hypothetical protein